MSADGLTAGVDDGGRIVSVAGMAGTLGGAGGGVGGVGGTTRLGVAGTGAAFFGTIKRETNKASSNKRIIGAITTIGATNGSATGVISSANTKRIKYETLRCLRKKSGETNPSFIKIKITMGNSNEMPTAIRK